MIAAVTVTRIGAIAHEALTRTAGIARVVARLTGSTYLDAEGTLVWLGPDHAPGRQVRTDFPQANGGPAAERRSALLTAARAALFLESLERGEPELPVDAAATVEMLDARTGSAGLERAVLDLPAYAGLDRDGALVSPG